METQTNLGAIVLIVDRCLGSITTRATGHTTPCGEGESIPSKIEHYELEYERTTDDLERK